MHNGSRPDFLIIGAPKAGTTALHAALAQHPEVFVSNPKEPKYWLCDDAPPPAWRGPGDRHSQHNADGRGCAELTQEIARRKDCDSRVGAGSQHQSHRRRGPAMVPGTIGDWARR